MIQHGTRSVPGRADWVLAEPAYQHDTGLWELAVYHPPSHFGLRVQHPTRAQLEHRAQIAVDLTLESRERWYRKQIRADDTLHVTNVTRLRR